MKVIEQAYWSIQRTEDGRGYDEMFQINDPDQELSEEDAFHLAAQTDDQINKYPQFFRARRKTRKVLV